MRSILSILLLASAGVQCRGQTVVGIRGAQFTINGQPTYTAASGFPSANHNLAGTLLNVRAVQAVFDDANYPGKGSRANPYHSVTQGEIFWDYPDGPWDPERNVREFLDALPSWRRCGLLGRGWGGGRLWWHGRRWLWRPNPARDLKAALLVRRDHVTGDVDRPLAYLDVAVDDELPRLQRRDRGPLLVD